MQRACSVRRWQDRRKFDEAEPLLIEGYEGMKVREDKIPAAGKVRLTEAIQRLVDLYTAWEKPEEAAKWKAVIEAAAPTPNN